MPPKSITKRIHVQQIAKLEKRVEKLEGALQVIHTWAAYDGDKPSYCYYERTLNPDHVMNLIERTLNE